MGMKNILVLYALLLLTQADAQINQIKKNSGNLLLTQSDIMLFNAKKEAGEERENAATEFILKGKVIGQNTGYVYLTYTSKDGKRVRDSSVLKNSQFSFTGNISEPTLAWFEGNVKSRSMDDLNATEFFLEPALMTAVMKVNDFKHARITGSKTQDETASLEKSKESIYDKMKPLNAAYDEAGKEYTDAVRSKKPDVIINSLKEKAAAIHEEFEPFQQQIAKINYSFFASHPNSYVTASNLRFYVSSLPLDSLQMFYNNMNTQLQQSANGKKLAAEIQKLQSGSPGAVAAVFTTTDINGNKLSLSDFKGKYVLIDFWASWCVPCRHSSPHLIEIFKKYHSKGFDIIGVADDDSKPFEWKKAVTNDGVDIWHHVLRGLDWDKIKKGEENINDISEKYGIHSLPTKILIDPDGVILGRYGGGGENDEAMDKMLSNIFHG
jgi:thiol-disulfide isomerase/thioredoxin